MESIIVVTHRKDWPLESNGVRIVTAHSYLTDPEFSGQNRYKVFNLCRHYRYQSFGYYVSLLAEARGHKSIPTVLTMEDLRFPALVRLASDELEETIQKSLHTIQSDRFVLSIYFGHNVAKRHDKLAMSLFKLFPAPFLRATFARAEQWELHSITAVPAGAIPQEHQEFALEATRSFFKQRTRPDGWRGHARYDLAILWDPDDPIAPSDERAVERFVKAAEEIRISAEVIDRSDYGRLAEFDALFIRVTTAVDHYSYRFSRKAAAEGLVVIDDPVSILRCTNKVFLAELFARNNIACPKTLIYQKRDMHEAEKKLEYPCILKRPDSSSSLGVVKVSGREEFREKSMLLFEKSDLLIAQEYLPTPFDWRIGVLDRRPLYAARYHMAPNHWQIIKHDEGTGQMRFGTSDILPVEEVPPEGLKAALKAANLIGDGMYGVDLKQVADQWYVIEVNDNPSLEYRVEDRYLKDELYRRVMATFLRRIEERKDGRVLR